MSGQSLLVAHSSLLTALCETGMILVNKTSRRRGSEAARKDAPLNEAGHETETAFYCTSRMLSLKKKSLDSAEASTLKLAKQFLRLPCGIRSFPLPDGASRSSQREKPGAQ